MKSCVSLHSVEVYEQILRIKCQYSIPGFSTHRRERMGSENRMLNKQGQANPAEGILWQTVPHLEQKLGTRGPPLKALSHISTIRASPRMELSLPT